MRMKTRQMQGTFIVLFVAFNMILMCFTLIVGKGAPPIEPGEVEKIQHCATMCTKKTWIESKVTAPTLYIVTPTVRKAEQIADLTRLGQTLHGVSKLHWIVVEDAPICSLSVQQLLQDMDVNHTHLVSPMPEMYRRLKYLPKGVSNRRAAIRWLRKHAPEGVVYFLDDDNTVDRRLLEEMRGTQRVSMFPVGLIGEYRISSPIVKEGAVVGFYDSWIDVRKFPVDMAGFAINLKLFHLNPDATMPYRAGHEETRLLTSLKVELKDIEPLADSCTKILVWHTRTAKNKPIAISTSHHAGTNIVKLQKQMEFFGMVRLKR